MKTKGNKLSKKQIAELKYLEGLSENQINTQDIPEMTDWSDARRGLFYKPVKRQITLRLDADVIQWFKAYMPSGRGYQTEINRALRDHIKRQLTE